jgi:lysyl-tRNA synthetase class II
MKTFTVFLALATNAFAATDTLTCVLNARWTDANTDSLSSIEHEVTAEIELADNVQKCKKKTENKFKFKNIQANKKSKYKYLNTLMNDKGNLVFKDLDLDCDNSDDMKEYVFTQKKDGIKVMVQSTNLKSFSLHVFDPKEKDDYLVFVDCH